MTSLGRPRYRTKPKRIFSSLDFSVKGLEAAVCAHCSGHILLGVLGALPGEYDARPGFRPQAHLPQGGGGAGIAGLGQTQSFLRFGHIRAAVYVQIKKRRIGVLGAKQLI